MKIEVYTAIAGGKDAPRTDITCFEGVELPGVAPVMQAKVFKILPMDYVKADVSIWLDGNIFLNIDKEELVQKALGKADMALFKHPYRDNIWQEFEICRVLGKGNRDLLTEQEVSYKLRGLGSQYGLFECNVLIRRHNKTVREFSELWWREICRWQHRDQVSFPVALELMKLRMNVQAMSGNVREHEWFTYEKHLI